MGAETLTLDPSNNNSNAAIEKKKKSSSKRKDHHSGRDRGSGGDEREKRQQIFRGFYEKEVDIRKRFLRELVTKGGIDEFEPDIHHLKTRIIGMTRILDSGLPLDLFVSDIQALTMKLHSYLHLDDIEPDKIIHSHSGLRISSSEYDARQMLEKERDELLSQLVNKLDHFRRPPNTSTGDGTNIYVGYLPPTLDDQGLINLFSPFGHVVSAKVVKDQVTGLCKGYGYVQFADLDHAHSAIGDMTFAPRCSRGCTTPIAAVMIGETPCPLPHPPLSPIALDQLLMQLLGMW